MYLVNLLLKSNFYRGNVWIISNGFKTMNPMDILRGKTITKTLSLKLKLVTADRTQSDQTLAVSVLLLLSADERRVLLLWTSAVRIPRLCHCRCSD